MTKRNSPRDEAQSGIRIDAAAIASAAAMIEPRRHVRQALATFRLVRDAAIDMGRDRREAILAAARTVNNLHPGVDLMGALGIEPKDPPDGTERPTGGDPAEDDRSDRLFTDLTRPELGPSGDAFDPEASNAFDRLVDEWELDLADEGTDDADADGEDWGNVVFPGLIDPDLDASGSAFAAAVTVLDAMLSDDVNFGPVLVPGFAGSGDVATIGCDGLKVTNFDNQNVASAVAVVLASGGALGTRAVDGAPNVAERPLRVVLWSPRSEWGLRKAVMGALNANPVRRPFDGELLALSGDNGEGVTLDTAYRIADDGYDVLVVAHAKAADVATLAVPGRVAVVAFGHAGEELPYVRDGLFGTIHTDARGPHSDAGLETSVRRGGKDDAVNMEIVGKTGRDATGNELHGVTIWAARRGRLRRAA